MSEAFDPFETIDFTSEHHFDLAVKRFGGHRTTSILGTNISHFNADWVFPDHQVIIEHKQLETDVQKSEAFARRAFELRVSWAQAGKANMFGIPHDWPSVSGEWLRLYKPTIEGIIKKANKQIRATRQRLGWDKGKGILIFSNKSVFEIYPLGMCVMIQTILEQSCSEIGSAVYIPNHYVDIPGSDLANVAWYPIYRHGGDHTPNEMVDFVDAFGRAFFDTLRDIVPDFAPRNEVALQTPEALRTLAARAIVPRDKR